MLHTIEVGVERRRDAEVDADGEAVRLVRFLGRAVDGVRNVFDAAPLKRQRAQRRLPVEDHVVANVDGDVYNRTRLRERHRHPLLTEELHVDAGVVVLYERRFGRKLLHVVAGHVVADTDLLG